MTTAPADRKNSRDSTGAETLRVGREVKLLDGPVKVRGALDFCADLELRGVLEARLVLSPHAHARVDSVDVEAARRVPGVVQVITAAELPRKRPSSRSTLLLAGDRVRFVGHPVALVIAESEAAAQDGADAVVVEYSPLPAVTDLEQALDPQAPEVWPEGKPGASEEAAAHGAAGGGGTKDLGAPNVASRTPFSRGDVAAGLAESDVVIERTFRTAPVHQAYIEPHATLVVPDPVGPGATVYSSTQATFNVRDAVAAALGVEHTQVRAVGTPVGGGFGGKFVLYEPLVALATQRVGRPVRLVLTRMEEMSAATPAPETRVRLKLGARSDGTLHALDAEMVTDNGCFPASMGVLAGVLLGSHYKFPHLRVEGIEVLTHRASTGAYRAPSAPQAAFALESAMDELARELGIDPIELRLRNASHPGDPMAMGAPWPSMGLTEVLEAVQSHPLWQQREQIRAEGRGVGVAVGGWPGGTEPAAAACALQSDGTVQVHLGTADITGTDTGFAAIAAEVFGVEPDRVRIAKADTSSSPYAGASGGSKTIYTVGPAVIEAAQEARRQTLELAAQALEADPEDLEIQDGAVNVKGSPDKSVSLATIASRTMRFGSRQAPVFGQGRHAQQMPSPGFCAQLAEVEVDEETGHVTLHRLVVAQDVGKAINPLLVRGQMAGGALQGVGFALYEQLVYDEQGQVQTATFSDYAVPHSTAAPPELDLIVVEVPSPVGPFGARGVGEPPIIATAGAIGNAIRDAVGVRLDHLPMTAPRVLAALAERD